MQFESFISQASPSRHRFAKGDLVQLNGESRGVVEMLLPANHYRIRLESGELAFEHDFDLKAQGIAQAVSHAPASLPHPQAMASARSWVGAERRRRP